MKITAFIFSFMLALHAPAFDLGTLVRNGLVLPDTLLKHHEELGITPDQGSRLQQIVSDATVQSAQLEAAAKEQQQAFQRTVEAKEATAEAVEAQLEKCLEAEAAVKRLQLHTLLALKAELTSEQRQQAARIAAADMERQQPLQERLSSEGQKLRSAFASLGVQPPEPLQTKGQQIAQMVRDGKLAEAEKALADLVQETGLNEEAPPAPDFSKFETGNTDVQVLQERYASVQERAGKVAHLPTLKLLIEGRDELEKAKAAEDIDHVARILTWAEGVLARRK